MNDMNNTTNNTNDNNTAVDFAALVEDLRAQISSTAEVQISGRTYEQRTFRTLADGDIVLAAYRGESRGRLGTGTSGRFIFRFRAAELADSQTRKDDGVRRWEVEERNALGFALKNAKSGTRPNYAHESAQSRLSDDELWLDTLVWVEVK